MTKFYCFPGGQMEGLLCRWPQTRELYGESLDWLSWHEWEVPVRGPATKCWRTLGMFPSTLIDWIYLCGSLWKLMLSWRSPMQESFSEVCCSVPEPGSQDHEWARHRVGGRVIWHPHPNVTMGKPLASIWNVCVAEWQLANGVSDPLTNAGS